MIYRPSRRLILANSAVSFAIFATAVIFLALSWSKLPDNILLPASMQFPSDELGTTQLQTKSVLWGVAATMGVIIAINTALVDALHQRESVLSAMVSVATIFITLSISIFIAYTTAIN
jgi:hypothetical protein